MERRERRVKNQRAQRMPFVSSLCYLFVYYLNMIFNLLLETSRIIRQEACNPRNRATIYIDLVSIVETCERCTHRRIRIGM
jgi:hypothetical protein